MFVDTVDKEGPFPTLKDAVKYFEDTWQTTVTVVWSSDPGIVLLFQEDDDIPIAVLKLV